MWNLGNPSKSCPLVANRYNTGKLPFSLLSVQALKDVAVVAQMGMEKYDRDNWRKGLPWTEVLDSALRHQFAWLEGENLDVESGLPHLAHAMWNLMTLLDYAVNHPECDDRPDPNIWALRDDVPLLPDDFVRYVCSPNG